jgi:hypothetical protein
MRGTRWTLGGVAITAALAFTSAAAATNQLVISPTDIAQLGFHPAGAPVRQAQAALKAGLRAPLQKLIRHARAQASAAGKGRERVTSAAFVFGSSGAAHRVLVAWKRAHHARKL